jgi:hypothetical protein
MKKYGAFGMAEDYRMVAINILSIGETLTQDPSILKIHQTAPTRFR